MTFSARTRAAAVLGLVQLVIVSAPRASASTKTVGGAGPEFPDSHAGRMAEAYVKAFNSGDEKQMREFESTHRSKAALAKRPMDERTKQYRELFAKWGKLDVTKILGDQSVALVVHAAVSDEWLNMTFELEAAEPHGL